MKNKFTIELPEDLELWLRQRRTGKRGATIEEIVVYALQMYKIERERALKNWHKRMEDPEHREQERERVREVHWRMQYK